MNLLFLDLETTGLDPEKNEILEIAANYYPDYEKAMSDSAPLETFQRKIRGFSSVFCPNISLGALNVNNVRFKDLVDPMTTTTPRVALREFMDWLLDIKKRGEFIVAGQNVNFDISFLNGSLKRHLNVEGLDSIIGYRVLDIASVGIFAMISGLAPGLTKASNEEMMKFFGRAKMVSKSHTATMDIESTEFNLRRFLEMVKPAIPYTNPPGAVA